uniref:Sensory neuron membrane protein 2 n=2 Tax=Rhodnius prolixus TaxID=13249 RepID=R4FK91_RHOPR
MRKCVNWLIFSALGFILAVGAFIFNLWILPMIVDYQVGKTMGLRNGTFVWDMFVETPVPIYLKVYFFNVENPEGIARGEIPRVKEVGPYVYRELRKKHDVTINEENDTVFYHQGTVFSFDAEKSYPLKATDKVVLVNFILHLISQVLESFSYPFSLFNEIVEIGLPLVMSGNSAPTSTYIVKDLLFDGFLITCNKSTNASSLANLFCSSLKHFPNIRILSETEDGNLLGALFRYKNTSYDGLFEVNRGVKEFASIGKIVSVDHKTALNNWKGDFCNKFAGSYDFTLLPPFVTKDSSFKIFSTDICSSAPVVYSGKAEYRGISGLRFKIAPEFMGNTTKYPQNSCYCSGSIGNLTSSGECPPLGTLNLAPCMNIPALVSYPHLLHTSPLYQSLVDGLKPNKTLHETFFDIEPTTGVPLKGYKRFQLNVLAKPSSAIRVLKDTKLALFPILWMEEGAEIGEDQVNILRDQLLKVLHIAEIIKWVLISCGISMAIIGAIIAIWLVRRRVHQHPD